MSRASSISSSETSNSTSRIITYAEAGVEGVREEMRRNPRIFYIGQGVGPRGGNFQQSRGLHQEFGEARVRDTPIAERAQTGLGIGAALAGSHPIVDIVFLDFTLEAMGEIKVGDPAIPKTPLIFEIGHNGAKELRLAPDESNTILKQFRRHLRHIALFLASGILLLTQLSRFGV